MMGRLNPFPRVRDEALARIALLPFRIAVGTDREHGPCDIARVSDAFRSRLTVSPLFILLPLVHVSLARASAQPFRIFLVLL